MAASDLPASTQTSNVRRTLERVARESHGRLIAYLTGRTRDIAAAEDALAEAFRSALESWPTTGVPERPEAWLLTTGRRKLVDQLRHGKVAATAAHALLATAEETLDADPFVLAFPDERLKLMFVCAHPAIDAEVRTPLMLQTVLGLDAARIAQVFHEKPATLGQRLSRAKTKIREAAIAYELPGERDLPARLGVVLEAIYAAFGSGWDDVEGADQRRRGLAAEAIELARLLDRLLPSEPETLGLLALMLHCEARREARRDDEARYVPLSEQDVARWSLPLVTEAEQLLARASRMTRPGRFQYEAAIHSLHARRMLTGEADWEAVALLYEGLVRIAPTLGALVGRASALAEARGPEVGYRWLSALPEAQVGSFQPYWALAAHLLSALGRVGEARHAYERAIALCQSPTLRTFLREQRDLRLGG